MKDLLASLIEKKIQERLLAQEKKSPSIPPKPKPPVKEKYRKYEGEEDIKLPDNDELHRETVFHMKKLKETLAQYIEKDKKEKKSFSD